MVFGFMVLLPVSVDVLFTAAVFIVGYCHLGATVFNSQRLEVLFCTANRGANIAYCVTGLAFQNRNVHYN